MERTGLDTNGQCGVEVVQERKKVGGNITLPPVYSESHWFSIPKGFSRDVGLGLGVKKDIHTMVVFVVREGLFNNGDGRGTSVTMALRAA